MTAPARSSAPDAVAVALGVYRDRLCLGAPPAAELVPAADFADPARLTRHLDRFAAEEGVADRRVAASIWSKYYNAAASIGVIAALPFGLGLVASRRTAHVVLRAGRPFALWLPAAAAPRASYRPRLVDGVPLDAAGWSLESAEALRRLVIQAVLWEHLAPLHAHLHRLTGLSPRILWGNLGALWSAVLDTTGERHAVAAAAAEDRRALLEAPACPLLGAPNPLYRPMRTVMLDQPDLPRTAPVRRTCCQAYQLPRQAERPLAERYCRTCPLLSPAERAERWRADAAHSA